MSEPQISRPSLADAFKGTGGGRAAGLSDLLPPAPRVSQPAKKQAEEIPEVAGAPAPKRPAKPALVKEPAAVEHVGVQNVAVYLEPEILHAVRAAKRQGISAGEPDKTYDEILVDALGTISVSDLASQFSETSAADNAGLMQRRIRRPRGSGGIQIQLRLDGGQRAALDDVVAKAGAPSRSALVAVAYRLYLA